MKLGSLFDGIGGFPLSGTRHGFEPVWASEIEPFPVKVTQKHFPGMKHLGDITKINGAEIEPVDVITFGSPCQDLSVAGKREGLAGERSGLFMEAVRIIREMRRATGGKYPRFAVWENVPGAFSSHGGQDFRAVLEEIGNAQIPMPKSGRWATAGMVRTKTADIAWRVLDAQYHGVPQRRRRIFLVADFGGQCSGEILFVEQGLRGDSAESREAGQEAAGDVGTGSAVTMRMREGCAGGGKGPLISEDKSLTLGCSNDQAVFTYKGIIPFDTTQITSPQNGNNPKPGDPCHPLCANAHVPSIAIPQTSYWDGGQISDCLDCSMLAKGQMMPEKRRFPAVLEPQLYDMTHADEVMRPVEKGIAPTLNSRMGTDGNQVPVLLATIQNATRGKSQNGLGISQDDVSYTLDSLGNHAVCIQGSMIGRADKNGPQGDGINENVSFTLNTIDRHAVAFACNQRDEVRDMKDKSGALQAQPGMKQQTFVATKVYGIYSDDSNSMKSDNPHSGIYEAETTRTLDQNGGSPACNQGGMAIVQTYSFQRSDEFKETDKASTQLRRNYKDATDLIVSQRYSVRRLTPLECERLQGFPDGWTDIPGQTEASKEELEFWRDVWLTWDKTRAENPEKVKPRTDKAILKWLKNPTSDSAQYKALGNSVAIPCVDFVMSGIARVLRKENQCE